MELLDHLAIGFAAAATPSNLLFAFIGCLIGTLVGVLPGVAPTATIAMLLPITYSLSPSASLIMLAGIFYGAQYGGSTTSILLNMPGEAGSAVTTIDGYQMARSGRAGPALAASAIGSFVAGSFATLVIAIFAIPLTNVALLFGPWEYFSLMVLGLVVSITLARGSMLKAIAMVVFGLLAGLVGSDVYTGALRFTMENDFLADGLALVGVSIGIFGLAEIIRNLEAHGERQVKITEVGSLIPTREDFKRMVAPIMRGTVIGSVLGILPGGGVLLSSFAAYAIEKKVSTHAHEFGHGAIEGVAAPESANNSAAQTSFIPMLTLGIPSSATMALMIGAMIIQGIVPGPSLAANQPALFWGVIVSMWIGNAMLVILNLPLIQIWVWFLRIPYYVLFPAILTFATIGVYSVNGNVWDLYTLSAFGVIGYILFRLDCEPAPFILGFVLGPMLEEHFRRSMIVSRGDVTAVLDHPLSVALLLASLAVLVISVLPAVTRKRDAVFVEED